MASISRGKNGCSRVLFENEMRDRKSLYLGKVPKRDAETVRVHVERLVNARIMNEPIPTSTAEWVAGLGGRMHQKLARAGLVESREVENQDAPTTLMEFLDWFDAERGKTRKDSTRVTWGNVRRNLIDYFGPDKRISKITEGDVESWQEHLKTVPAKIGGKKPLSSNTIRRRSGIAKQFFRAAVRKKWLKSNPFDVLESLNVRANRSRDYFLTREDCARLIDAAPDVQWRVIIALARYGGLRTPSETLALRWGDVLWEEERLVVTDPKRSHHDGKETRVIPLFPELREYLDEAWQLLGDEPAEFVVTRYRDATQNLRTTFTKIIKRAGLTPWPKLFHNLRASRQTELAAEFPIHVVCEWIGNSQAIAQEHYLRVTDDDFNRASKTTRKTTQNTPETTRTERKASEQDFDKSLANRQKHRENSVQRMGGEGLEPPASCV